jgi:hypothetical protein
LYSWRATAESTRAVYHEAVDRVRHGRRYAVRAPSAVSEAAVDRAVGRTLAYARQFDFPLTVVELRERLFDVGAALAEVEAAVTRLGIPVIDGHLTPTAALVEERRRREKKTAAVLRDTWKEIRFIARFPFVRMVALSGAAAHGNMTDADVDLFAVVEHRRLWFVLAATTVWAKLRGIRGVICLNYLVSDRALALPDTDGFTAQQAASLKPIFGKDVYDRFLAANPFVRRTFPNFEPARHRDRYPEVSPSWSKEVLEAILCWGPGAAGESVSRIVFGRYLRSKAGRREDAARDPFDAGDVVLETTRIKLHLRSHRHAAISALEAEAPPATPRAGRSAGGSVARALAPDADRGREKNAKVHAG